ncbi:MAG: anaerobic glycerol-3-phosphate dehydrogenase subunit B [Deltaproteobacteria bacterium]|nr:anaerobic glycerol-3-phosphate dehydrogenase subunit B [Candidatus Zymogenaceae bacterium]
MKYDTVVIGAGLGGLMAALSAAERGKKTLVVSRGMGIITIFSGTIDILGYYPVQDTAPLSSPREGVERLISEDPKHPYARVGVEALEKGMSFFQEAVAREGVTYVGNLDRNFLVPTAVGTIKPTAFLSKRMEAGDVREESDVLIAGFRGLKDFYPAYMAHNISTSTVPGVSIPHFRGRVLDVDIGADGSGMSALTLARKMEEDAMIQAIGRALFCQVRDGERIALPAVLGIRGGDEVFRRLEDMAGTRIFETPTLPPSVTGYRLYRALESRVRASGIRLLIGYDVHDPEIRGGRVAAVNISMGKKTKRIEGDTFVLATGGLVGRGIITDRKSTLEPIFGLPVSGPSRRNEWFAERFFDPSGHPINKIGLEVDDRLRPTGDGKKHVYENLFACGAELAGYAALREKSGGGVTIASGFKAGRLAGEL